MGIDLDVVKEKLERVSDEVGANSAAIVRIGGEVTNNKAQLDAHVKINEVLLGNIDKNMTAMLAEIKTQGRGFEEGLRLQQQHIEEKISKCYTDIHSDLKDNYVTRDAVLLIKDDALFKAKEDRNREMRNLEKRVVTGYEKKVRFALWIIGGMLSGAVTIGMAVFYILDKLKVI